MFSAIQGSPEVPNILKLLARYFPNSSFLSFLYHWQDLVFSFLAAILISFVFFLGSRKKELIPSGLQNFLEWIVEHFRNFVVGVIGPDGEKYVPFLGTLFIYILTMNLMGLIPLVKSPSSSLNITIAMALCVFGLVQYLNIKHMGLKGFLYHLAGSPKNAIGWLLAPLMLPIELITQISRPVTLALRLFGNIMGEKVLVGFFVMVGVTVFFFFPIHTPFMFLGLFTGVLQALVFTLLSTIYILLSVPHDEEHDTNH